MTDLYQVECKDMKTGKSQFWSRLFTWKEAQDWLDLELGFNNIAKRRCVYTLHRVNGSPEQPPTITGGTS